MRNFGRVLAIVTIICFEVTFLVHCQQENQKYPWVVNEDEEKVEKIVIRYARTKRRNVFSSFFQLLHNIIHRESGIYAETETNLLIMSPNNKFFLCAAMLRIGYFGLKFVEKNEKEMVAQDRKISLKRLKRKKLSPDILPTHQCPKLQYFDLETGKATRLSIRYYISGSHLADSFLLYRQEEPNLPIYPHKFASQVNFDELDELRSMYDAIARKEKSEIDRMSFFPVVSMVVSQLTASLEIRKSGKAYDKLRDTIRSSNFCGLPKTHKIALCRYMAECLRLQLDHRGYDEYECRKRKVFHRPATPEGPRGDYTATVYMAKCPVLREVYDKRDEFRIITIFLAASYQPNSLLLFQRLNTVGEDIQPGALITNLYYHELEKDTRRVGEFLRPEYIEGKTEFIKGKTENPKGKTEYVDGKAEYIDSAKKIIQLTGLKMAPQIPSITYDRSVVEDNTIAFVQIKAIKEPYRRFMMSYGTINISMWSEEDIARLCDTIFYDATYDVYTEKGLNNDVIFVGRSHIEVRLVMRDAELLPNNKIHTRQCPADIETSSSYFIMGTVYPDAVTVLVKYEHKDYAYPEAFVHNMNEAKVRTQSDEKI